MAQRGVGEGLDLRCRAEQRLVARLRRELGCLEAGARRLQRLLELRDLAAEGVGWDQRQVAEGAQLELRPRGALAPAPLEELLEIGRLVALALERSPALAERLEALAQLVQLGACVAQGVIGFGGLAGARLRLGELLAQRARLGLAAQIRAPEPLVVCA